MEAPDFFVEDLLDLSNGGDDIMTDAFFDTVTGNSTDSSSLTPASDSCNSSVSCAPTFPDAYFNGGDLCVPYDDMAELEWLSNFVEESFSTDDLHKLQFIPTGGAPLGQTGPARPGHNPPTTVPGKARSKRSRVAPCDWSTRLLMVSAPSPATSSSEAGSKKQPSLKRRDNGGPESGPGEVRRCMHCASEKTPQWRTGPMGPKTLCNACGVRYKSGRLVPEYRPAASPTFVSAKHSNSHRKVMELRRQKDVQRHPQPHHHHHHQPPQQQQFIGGGGHHMIMATGGGGGNGGEDFFNYHHHHLGGADYRQMI